MRTALLCAPLLLLASCGPRADTNQFAVAPGGYDAAFDATRETLRSARFQLARVDSQAGVITTEPKHSAGLFTPWDMEQSNLSQEFEDAINDQNRSVRVTFEDTNDGGKVGHVWVTVTRVQKPGARIPSRAITLTSATQDPYRTGQGVGYAYEVPTVRDEEFEQRLAGRIAQETAKRAKAAAAEMTTPPNPQ